MTIKKEIIELYGDGNLKQAKQTLLLERIRREVKKMNEVTLEVGKSYFVTRGDIITKKIVKTRKSWKFQGTQKGGLLNMLYYIFSRTTQRTYREMAIPRYLLKEVKAS